MLHAIPAAALEAHIAVLGKTGSGKTYGSKSAVEALLGASARVWVIDPTGAWHGLRSSATGKSAGFPVVIFGGEHADFPLGRDHGEALAEIAGTSSTSGIIDTSLMRVGERTKFFADFADALVRKNKGPLHLVIDEAHLFAPQGKVNDPQSGMMLNAANNLVSLGRSRGLRIILISQRPAKIHKDSLTQAETLIAMRLIAPQDRAAVKEWIKDNAGAEQGDDVITSLATLKTGSGWLWAPELNILDRIAFPKIRTYDSSRAPTAGESGGPVLAPIDRDDVAKRLETVAAAAVANDPARLKAENARLRAQVTRLERDAEGAAKTVGGRTAEEIAKAERDYYAQGFANGANAAWGALPITALQEVAKAVLEAKFPDCPPVPAPAGERPPGRAIAGRGAAGKAPIRDAQARPVRIPSPPPRNAGKAFEGMLGKGERACLIAIAQHDGGVTRAMLTVLTGYKRSSRDTYVQRLGAAGYTTISGERIYATGEGVKALGSDYEELPTGLKLQERVLSELPEGERRILEILIGGYPENVSREAISEATNYQRSSRDTYLQRLSARELVVTERGSARASANLFD